VKPLVEERTDALKQRAKYTDEILPHALNLQNDITKECWEKEMPIFQEEVKRALEREHEIKLKAWRESYSDSPSRTPEEYSS
jgi:hypothetical protein